MESCILMSKLIYITNEEKKKIFSFAQKIIEDAHTNKKSSWKLRSNYNVKSICIGTLGEYGYGKMTGQKVNMKLESRGDGGIDFIDGAQVKTCTYNGIGKKELKVNNLFGGKKPKKYVLAFYDSNAKNNFVTLIGEISYENFINKKKIKTYNGKSVYVVDETQLDKLY